MADRYVQMLLNVIKKLMFMLVEPKLFATYISVHEDSFKRTGFIHKANRTVQLDLILF